MPIAPTSGSRKGSDVLLDLRNRLIEGLQSADPDTTIDASFVRIVAHPGPEYANYRAERGVSLMVSEPQPFTPSGAGRYGLKVTRILEVHVATQNLLDAAYEDEKAVLDHIDLEERVADVLVDASPTGTPLRAGIKVRWIPGGAKIERLVRKDTGKIVSAILFEVEYVAPLQVNRE